MVLEFSLAAVGSGAASPWAGSYPFTAGFCVVPSLTLSANSHAHRVRASALLDRKRSHVLVIFQNGNSLSIANIMRLLQRGSFEERESQRDRPLLVM